MGEKKFVSSGENQVIQALSDLGFEEDLDYVFDECYHPLTEYSGKRLRFDFRFLEHDIVIEYSGREHYQPAYFGSRKFLTPVENDNLKKVQALDRLKDDFCNEYGFKLIRIAYTDVANILSILSNELFHIVNWFE